MHFLILQFMDHLFSIQSISSYQWIIVLFGSWMSEENIQLNAIIVLTAIQHSILIKLAYGMRFQWKMWLIQKCNSTHKSHIIHEVQIISLILKCFI